MKPFDLLFIESPYEYIYRNRKVKEETKKGLTDLGEICRTNNIPVIVTKDISDDPEDRFVKSFFKGTDYTKGEYPVLSKKLSSIQPEKNELRVMVIGGYLSYVEKDGLKDLDKLGLTLDQLENYNPKGKTKEFVIAKGCVHVRCHSLYVKIKELGKKPLILIDPRASVHPKGEFDDNSLYP